MLVGLLRLRRGGGGKFELGRLLWKQVRWWQVLLTRAVVLLICIHILKGVIWLLIGTVTELMPVVSLAGIIPHFICAHSPITLQLFISLYLRGNFVSPKSVNEECLRLLTRNLFYIRCCEYCMFLYHVTVG